MNDLKTRLRWIRHPYLIWDIIIKHYEWMFNKRVRVGEYERYTYSMENGLRKLLGIDIKRIRDINAQFYSKIEFSQRMNKARAFLGRCSGGMGKDACALLSILFYIAKRDTSFTYVFNVLV